ncbi:hypothetical protein C3L33_05835, partial [Rhododendron williamsianum]
MADQHQHPTVIQKVVGQLHLSSNAQTCYGGYQKPAHYQRRFSDGNYSNVALQYPMSQMFGSTNDLSLVAANASPVFVQAPSEKGAAAFPIDFLMVGVSITVFKTAAAPIERVKLLIQNQDEMIKSEVDKDYFKRLFNFKKDRDGYWKWFAGSLASGGAAGASCLLFVYSLDYARTRRQLHEMVLLVFTVDSTFHVSASSCFVHFVLSDSIKPVVLTVKMQDSFFASFALAWVVTNGAVLASYPIDTVRRRMTMTSGEAVKYKSSFDAFSQILKNEVAKSLFKGAGANILRAVAGAVVLAGYDKLRVIVFRERYGSIQLLLN